MATLAADFNFAASMITGHILEVYPSLTGALGRVTGPKQPQVMTRICRFLQISSAQAQAGLKVHITIPWVHPCGLASVDSAALPVWSLVFDSTFRGKPCEALGLQQMGGGDEMSWQSKRLFYNGKKYDYDIYIIIYIYICMYHVYVYTYTYNYTIQICKGHISLFRRKSALHGVATIRMPPASSESPSPWEQSSTSPRWPPFPAVEAQEARKFMVRLVRTLDAISIVLTAQLHLSSESHTFLCLPGSMDGTTKVGGTNINQYQKLKNM